MSKNKEGRFSYSINELFKNDTNSSYLTKYDSKKILNRSLKELHQLGFMVRYHKGINVKHLYKLVEHWKEKGQSPATIKNKLSKFRLMARLSGNSKILQKTNHDFGVEKRNYSPKSNRAIENINLKSCKNPYIKLSIDGQRLFGLRREESMKIIISEADTGSGLLYLSSSWTKGGISRTISIRTAEQKKWISDVKKLVGENSSLIPQKKSYYHQLNCYKYELKKLGLLNLHGLRHAYAQKRYRELTKLFDVKKNGWECPIKGGKSKKEMTIEEKRVDYLVRKILVEELGHSRIDITKTYLG